MTRVLIVDDDPLVCAAIEICLERHGFEVTIADGGEAGLRALEDSSFDLMIVDIFAAAHAGLRIDQDIPRTRAGDSAGCDVGIRLRQPRFADAGFPAHGARTRCRALPPQAVHADGAAGTSVNECLAEARVPFQRRRPVEPARLADIPSPTAHRLLDGPMRRSQALPRSASLLDRGGGLYRVRLCLP